MPAEPVVVTFTYRLDVAPVNFYAYGSGTPYGAYDTENPLEGSGDKTIGTPVEIIDAPEYANFTFKEWNTQADGSGDAYQPGDTPNVVAGGMNFYAIYDRVAVKLVPVDEDSTAMIERNGAIESYNDGYSVTDSLPETPENFKTYYVYGLETNMGADNMKLDTYVKVTGDGYYTLTLSVANQCGTGAKISVYDRNGTDDDSDDTLIEEFYIVIFGDVDGDSIITGSDSTMIKAEVNKRSWSSGENIQYYRVKAADVDGDTIVSGSDSTTVKSVVNKKQTVNQITGLTA